MNRKPKEDLATINVENALSNDEDDDDYGKKKSKQKMCVFVWEKLKCKQQWLIKIIKIGSFFQISQHTHKQTKKDK